MYFKMREEDLEIAIKVSVGEGVTDVITFYYILLSAVIQVVIVGNGGVGKSSMIQRYCKGIYTKDYKKTIGVDFLERQIE
jgi:GTP-binding protein EngB required for normal cell division